MDTPAPPRSPLFLNSPDRWNKPKMAVFLRELAASHCVATAAKAVGMSRQSAYRLRNRLKGEPFDIAWEAAFQHGYEALHQAALERALHGWEEPVFYKGEQIGTRPRFDAGLTRFLLSARNRSGAQQLSRYRAAADFYSERWDELLLLVEEGPTLWEREEAPGTPVEHLPEWLRPTPENRATLARARADEASRRSIDYTAPDPLPKGRGG
jgi:hypothetical protein